MLGDFPIKKKGELVGTFGKHPSSLHSTRGAYHLAKKFHYFGGMLMPGGVLPYMGYMGMCRCEGSGFQAVYSRIGYINQSV